MLPGFPDAAPLAGLLGGVLIGLAAALTLLGAGRIAGVSGIAARAFGISGDGMPRSDAWAFVLGLPIGALLVAWSRSEEHTSELQSLMRISYAVFCFKKKNR